MASCEDKRRYHLTEALKALGKAVDHVATGVQASDEVPRGYYYCYDHWCYHLTHYEASEPPDLYRWQREMRRREDEY